MRPERRFALRTLVAALAAAFPLRAAPQPPPSAPSAIREGAFAESGRLPAPATVPLAYFRQVSDLRLRCQESPARTRLPAAADSSTPALCAAVRGLADSLPPADSVAAGTGGPAVRGRIALLAALRRGFRPDSLFTHPDWGKRLRLAAYLDTAGFLGWTRKYGLLPDSLDSLLDSSARRLARSASRDSAFLAAGRGKARDLASPDGRLAAGFQALVPDLGAHLDLARRREEAAVAGACLEDPDCATLYHEFDVERLAEAAPDTARQRLRVPWIGAFQHKLRICLKDAIWFEGGRNRPDFQYSGYFFHGIHELSRVDSARISGAIEAFGIENAAYRQRADEPGWDPGKARELEERCRRASREILKGLSPRLADYLVDRGETTGMRVTVSGIRHPDLFGDLKLADALADYFVSADSGTGTPHGMMFPFLPEALLADAIRSAEGGDARAFRRLLKLAAPQARNYLCLTLSSDLEARYLGTSEGLKRLAEGERKL